MWTVPQLPGILLVLTTFIGPHSRSDLPQFHRDRFLSVEPLESLALQGTHVQVNPLRSSFPLLPSMVNRHVYLAFGDSYCFGAKDIEVNPKPLSVQCPQRHSFTDCACRIIRLAETDCDGPIKRKIFESARALGHKRRFTMRYPNGERVGLPMLDAACRSQTDGRPMPRMSVQREENAGEACRVLRYQMLP